MSELSHFHAQSMERINSTFFEQGDGLAATLERSRAVDEIVRGYWRQFFEDMPDCAILAVGGFGREELFPHSDVDLLILLRKDSQAAAQKERIGVLLTNLWDARLRVSQSVRSLDELTKLAPDNSELHISLLDTRFLAGDRALFNELAENRLPRFFVRERKSLLNSLVGLARLRHQEFGQTIYHLEPDIKEGPGGLRDLQLASWIGQLSHMTQERIPTSLEYLPSEFRESAEEARRFLFAVRCYLHYFSGRDSNRLLFDLQESIANDGSGKAFREVSGPADWMRDHFRHGRAIHRMALRAMDENASEPHSLFRLMRSSSSRLSNQDFSVTRGRVFLRYSQALESQPETMLRLFRFVGRHGLPLAVATERLAEASLDAFRQYVAQTANLWPAVADLLKQPRAYDALLAMHDSGALTALLPELEAIDCLVIRDFYHRYTVDEHTFLAIHAIHALPREEDPVAERFARLAEEVDHIERPLFALLFHDVGRGVDPDNPIAASLRAADQAIERLGVDKAAAKQIRFLIENHLLMGDFLTRRDISDPETLEEFANAVGTVENLRALTLVTYADLSAVNPHSLTPWRKKLLWQLYLSVYNRLTGRLEDARIGETGAEEICAKLESPDDRAALRAFLEGFPERYLRTHNDEQVLQHLELSRQLNEKLAAVHVDRADSRYEVTMLTWDRPFLFAALCAGMAGFGLNIERAEAFANDQGMVLDSFTVTVSELRGGAELDDHEMRQLGRTLRRIVEGREDVHQLLAKRRRLFGKRGRSPVETEVSFDNQSSSRASVFHVIAEDRNGLLYDLTSAFSQHDCDIEVVLSETQGRKAVDVFYVVRQGEKLTDQECEELLGDLRGACRSKAA